MTRFISIAFAASIVFLDFSAAAQDCAPSEEFCVPAPPCYREPDNPDCNPDCHCLAPDYPECDPYCAPGDLCDTDCQNPCWDEFGRDVCTEPPPPCVPTTPTFTFADNMDGIVDGQIVALSRSAAPSCGTVTVAETGYYAIYDTELSESCADQRDETGYLTVHNSCNADGWAVERNAGDRFLILDTDNDGAGCTDGTACSATTVCHTTPTHGTCCVPTAPVFMGTYLLVAGESNRICIHHWCPEWATELAAGRDYGFVTNGCTTAPESIHFKIGGEALACVDDTVRRACSWGCNMGSCNPDPCDTVSCPAYCMDGVCTTGNPCDGLACEHGCYRGRCLQGRNARGPDADMDGFSVLADCDDTNSRVHPGRSEVCGNAIDDNCDGYVDESPCVDVTSDGGVSSLDGGGGSPDGSVSDGGSLDGSSAGPRRPLTGGCGCRTASSRPPSPSPTACLGLALLVLSSRRRTTGASK